MPAGFTLLEVLVVVVLIGIIVSVVTVSATTGNLEDKLKEEARRMQALMSLASEEAILRNQELALSVGSDAYRFEVLEQGRWKAIEGDRLFRRRDVAAGLDMSLLVEETELSLGDDEEAAGMSRIFFLSSGEVLPPFELVLKSENAEFERRLRLNENGDIEIVKPEEFF